MTMYGKLMRLGAAALSLAACDDDNPTEPVAQPAQLRVVNAANIADVRVSRAGVATPLVQGLNHRSVTATCLQLPAGQQTLTFAAGGQDVATAAFDFVAGRRYTVALVANGQTRRAVVMADNHTAEAGNNALRFVNATTAAGDVYVSAPGAAVGATSRVIVNGGPLATSNEVPPYFGRSTQHTQVRLFNPGVTAGAPRADFELTGLPASRLATVVFTEVGTPAAFLVTPCP